MHTRFYAALFAILILSGLCPSFATAQAGGPIAKQVEQYAEKYAGMPTTSLFEAQVPPAELRRQAQKEVQQATYLESSPMGIQQLLRQRPEQLKLALPLNDGSQLILRLYQSQPLSEDVRAPVFFPHRRGANAGHRPTLLGYCRRRCQLPDRYFYLPRRDNGIPPLQRPRLFPRSAGQRAGQLAYTIRRRVSSPPHHPPFAGLTRLFTTLSQEQADEQRMFTQPGQLRAHVRRG